MKITKAVCVNCQQPMTVTRMTCSECGLVMEGPFEGSALGRLSDEDQIFVTAFVRYHGSIKKMEELFDISYPTVKNRLNAITEMLDQSLKAPSTNSQILEKLKRGEITVNEALNRIR